MYEQFEPNTKFAELQGECRKQHAAALRRLRIAHGALAWAPHVHRLLGFLRSPPLALTQPADLKPFTGKCPIHGMDGFHNQLTLGIGANTASEPVFSSRGTGPLFPYTVVFISGYA